MTKTAPTRTCIACGQAATKQGLLRVVKSPEGVVSLDPGGKAPGRGAYVCQDPACFEKAVKRRIFDGKLRTRLSAADYQGLKDSFDALCATRAELR